MQAANLLTRSENLQITNTQTHHNNNSPALLSFPIKLQYPNIQKEDRTLDLQNFLDRGTIPPTHDAKIQVASWCAKHCIRHGEPQLTLALSHLIETAKVDSLNLSCEDLSGNQRLNKLIDLLEKHKSITGIILNNCNLSAEQIANIIETAISKKISIESLSVCRNNLNSQDGVIIGNALKNDNNKDRHLKHTLKHTFKHLDFSHNVLDQHGVKAICDALQDSSTIQVLKFSANDLGPSPENGLIGVQAIADLLNINTSLSEIDLSGNTLYSEGLSPILNALKNNRTLKIINFCECHLCERYQPELLQNGIIPGTTFDPAIYKKIANMLRENQHLETLILSMNLFGSSGFFQIMKGLCENKTLQNLVLGYQKYDYLEVHALAYMLMKNTSLRFLGIPYAMLDSECIRVLTGALQSSLRRGCMLTSLDLRGNCIGEEGKSLLASALKNESSSLCEIDIGRNRSDLKDDSDFDANDADMIEIEKACKRNRNRLIGVEGAEAFFQGALIGFIKSYSADRVSDGIAKDIASRINPWIAFESNLPILNKSAWEMANTVRDRKIEKIADVQGPNKFLLRYQFVESKHPFTHQVFDEKIRDFVQGIPRNTIAAFSGEELDMNNGEFLQKAWLGNLKTIQSLLTAGEDPNQTCHNGNTALLEAVRSDAIDILGLGKKLGFGKKLDVVKYLIDKISDPHTANLEGVTPLEVASENGDLDIVKFLIENGADPHQGRSFGNPANFGLTPLMAAAKRYRISVVQFLVNDQKVDPNQTDIEGATPLFYAVVNGATKHSSQVIQFLLDNKANINQVTLSGLTPLHVAAEYGNLPAVELFIQHGADVSIADSCGFNALYKAALRNTNESDAIIRTLIKHGVPLDGDFHIEKETNLSMQCTLVVMIGKIWIHILTAPTKLSRKKNVNKVDDVDNVELLDLKRLEKNAQTLIDRLSILSPEECMLRITGVTLASTLDPSLKFLRDYPYLTKLFDNFFTSNQDANQNILATLEEKMRRWDATKVNRWGDGKRSIFNIKRNQLPTLTQNMLDKLSIQ